VHEFGIMENILEAVTKGAKDAGATKVLSMRVVIGEMSEVVEDALRFAFDALVPDTMCDGAELIVEEVRPKSRCHECGLEYEHDRFHLICPNCGSYSVDLIAGREMYIDSIEVETPDD
jgi:hydrogenase nickel incorporation protein HypA/HybF